MPCPFVCLIAIKNVKIINMLEVASKVAVEHGFGRIQRENFGGVGVGHK